MKTSCKCILFFCLCLSAGASYAGNRVMDSLKVVLAKATNDSEKLRLLDIMANGITSSNKKALQFATQGLQIAEKDRNKKWVRSFLHIIGNIYCNESDFSKALSYYLKEVKEIEMSGLGNRPLA